MRVRRKANTRGVDQFGVIQKLLALFKAPSISVMGELIGTDPGTISRMRSNQERISHPFFLKACIRLDRNPNELSDAIGLPRNFFFIRRDEVWLDGKGAPEAGRVPVSAMAKAGRAFSGTVPAGRMDRSGKTR